MGKLIAKREIVSALGKMTGGGRMWHCTMTSDTLGVNKEFTVYLPESYDETADRRYPTVYLFHHAGGTHETWGRMGQIKQIADDSFRSLMAMPMILVMPDASGEDDSHLGRYLGYFSVDGWDYETYFHRELIPLVDATFHTVADKKGRALVGPSMGGEAAISYAQRYPAYYAASCSMSGILGKPEQSRMADTDKDYAESLIRNNPSAYVSNADAQTVEALKTVKWYADCGDSDFFCEGNVEFFLAMRAKGIPMDYRMRSGVHGFYYWITGLPPILQFLTTVFTL